MVNICVELMYGISSKWKTTLSASPGDVRTEEMAKSRRNVMITVLFVIPNRTAAFNTREIYNSPNVKSRQRDI